MPKGGGMVALTIIVGNICLHAKLTAYHEISDYTQRPTRSRKNNRHITSRHIINRLEPEKAVILYLDKIEEFDLNVQQALSKEYDMRYALNNN